MTSQIGGGVTPGGEEDPLEGEGPELPPYPSISPTPTLLEGEGGAASQAWDLHPESFQELCWEECGLSRPLLEPPPFGPSSLPSQRHTVPVLGGLPSGNQHLGPPLPLSCSSALPPHRKALHWTGLIPRPHSPPILPSVFIVTATPPRRSGYSPGQLWLTA